LGAASGAPAMAMAAPKPSAGKSLEGFIGSFLTGLKVRT
jgi:CDP-diglyceride synthetase